MDYEKGKKPIVQDINPSLPIDKYIKLGKKGEKRTSSGYRLPQKDDRFTIATTEREVVTYKGKKEKGNFIRDEQAHKELGESPKKIPIRLIYNEIGLNFPSRRVLYFGKKLLCSGDGEFAHKRHNDGKIELVDCPCYRAQPEFNGDNSDGKGVCKLHGDLFCLLNIKNTTIGGMCRLSTSGYYAISGMVASMMMYQRLTTGVLAGIPFDLTLLAKDTTEVKTGRSVKVYYPALLYSGGETMLKAAAYKILEEQRCYIARIERVEEIALQKLDYDKHLLENSCDIVEEFHPDEMIGDIAIGKKALEDLRTPGGAVKEKKAAPARSVVAQEKTAAKSTTEDLSVENIDVEITDISTRRSGLPLLSPGKARRLPQKKTFIVKTY